MKVNIIGKGVIPGIGTLAPKYDVELSEAEIKRLVNYRQFRIGDCETGLLITSKNVDAFFTKPTKLTELPKPEPISIEPAPVKKEEPKKEPYVEPELTVTVEEVPELSIPEEIVQPEEVVVEFTEPSIEEIIIREAPQPIVEKFGNLVEEDPISEEVPEEKQETTPHVKRNKKKRRS